MQDDEEQQQQQMVAQVVYYLCRNGKVEPPHMIDVAHSPQGLRLRDVKQRLTVLRGCRMPAMYAWSFKRVYKHANIWQDVSGDDFMLPVSSGEYVLKGSEIVEDKSPSSRPPEILQRKFWGAETWLTTSVDGKPQSLSRRDQELATLAAKSRALTGGYERSPDKAAEAAAAATTSRLSSSSAMQDSGVQSSAEGIKVYAIKPPAVADHGCDAATQTEDVRRRKQQQLQNAASAAAAAASDPAGSLSKSKSKHSQEIVSLGKSTSLVSTKKLRKFRRAPTQDKQGELHTTATKATKSASWVLFHILSYCGGLQTKAQAGGCGGATPLVQRELSSECDQNRDWKTDAEVTSFSDTSRETPGDSFQSSDASDEGRTHKISTFVDVKEMVVTTRSASPSGSSQGPSNFSFMSRQYGRLSRSGTYYPRNVKYGNQEPLADRQGAFKLELNCYRAE